MLRSRLSALLLAMLLALPFTGCGGGGGDDFDCCDNLPPGEIEFAYVYVANVDDDTISGFEVDEFGDVEELPGSPYDTFGVWPVALTVTPDTDFLFVANNLDGSIASYFIFFDGEIVLSAEPFNVGESPVSMAMHPSGDFLYVTTESDEVFGYEIDLNDGELDQVFHFESSGGAPGFITIDADGRFLYTSNSESGDISGYTIDANTGELTEMEGSPFPIFNPDAVFIGDMAITPDSGFLYLTATCFDCGLIAPLESVSGTVEGEALLPPVGDGAVIRFTIDEESGELTGNGEDDVFFSNPGPTGIAATPDGDFLYVSGWVEDTINAFEVSAADGELDELGVSPFDTDSSPAAVGIGADGLVLAVPNIDDDSVSVYLVDDNGVLLEIDGSPFEVGESPIAIVATD